MRNVGVIISSLKSARASALRNGPRLAALCLLSAALAGCAVEPASRRDRRDPWQRMNRATWSFDYAFYIDVAGPLARAYVRVTPQSIREGVSNFFQNLKCPTVIANDLLQGQPSAFGSDAARLVLNTTLGIGGLLDPATAIGLARNDRDFGQTFGKWGVPPGPYLVLPFLGPADMRDAIGLVPAQLADPLNYMNNTTASYAAHAVGALDTAAGLLPELKLDEHAYDHYAFARDAYLSRRRFLVRGNDKNEGANQELQELERPDGI